MRRPLLVLSVLALALVAACAPTAAPAWTYAPPTPAPTANPSASAGPSGAASAGPSGAASAAPSAAASGAASAAPSGGSSAGGSTVQISALNIAFEQQTITAPAGTPFTIHFDNKDAGIPHNVEIKDGSGMTMFKGDIITGPAQADYSVPALPAGSYTFLCIVHPNMTGTLTVGP